MPARTGVERVVLINDATDARGGATGLAVALAELIVDAGVDVTFLTGGGPDAALAKMGIEVIALGERSLIQRNPLEAARNGLYHAGAAAMIREWIEAHDHPGVVYHVHGWSKRLSPAIFSALRPVAHRVLVHAHDYFLLCPNGAFMHYPARRSCSLTPLSPRCVLSACDRRNYAHKAWRVMRQLVLRHGYNMRPPWGGVLLIHSAMRQRFLDAGAPSDRVHVLPNPAIPFTADRIPAAMNRDLLFIGRLDEEKGVMDAAAAARAAGASLTVIGEGPMRAQLVAEYPEVTLLGWLPHAAIGPIVRKARLLLVPSRYPEPFGLVIAEAFRSGLPVVVAETALMAQDVTRLGLGKACDTRDIEAFAATLIALLGDDVQVESMSLAGHAARDGLALSPFAWRDALLARYANVLTEAASHHEIARPGALVESIYQSPP